MTAKMEKLVINRMINDLGRLGITPFNAVIFIASCLNK